MKVAVVTGVTGFIGGALTKELLEIGIKVYGIDLDTPKMNLFKKYDNFVPIIADFTKYEIVPSFIYEKNIDVFYHFAWEGGFTTALRNYHLQMKNAAFAGDALILAKSLNCKKFVYAGTYNQAEIKTFLMTENFEPRYTCLYSTAKTAADLICRTLAHNLGIQYCTALIPMPYGEGNYSKQLANIVIDCFNKGISPKLVEGNNMYDFVYIEDIAKAFVAIGQKGRDKKEYYIGHRQLKTFKNWIIDIRNILAPDINLKFGEFKDNQNIDYSLIDLDALYNDTGFECNADFKRSIEKTAEWVKHLNME